MNRLLLPLLAATMLLSGCTDIRNRVSADVLAMESTAASTRFAMHAIETDRYFTAETNSPMALTDALQNAAGASLSTGHLSLFLLDDNPAVRIPQYLKAGYLPSSCMVLYLPAKPCKRLLEDAAPDIAQLKAAIETAQLPPRPADVIAGDLQSGTGITAIPSYDGTRLTLALFDEAGCLGFLSDDATRGFALLAGGFSQFSFPQEDALCTIHRASFAISVSQEGECLRFTLTGRLHGTSQNIPDAEVQLTDMLQAALIETAKQSGADLLYLREAARRDDIPAAGNITSDQWKTLLQSADYQTEIHLISS